MAKKQQTESNRSVRPAIDHENRMRQLASMAFDLLEQRLRDGTATSQEVTTLVKEYSSTAMLQKEVLELNKELTKAKTESLRAQKDQGEKYIAAIKALSRYQGRELPEDYEV